MFGQTEKLWVGALLMAMVWGCGDDSEDGKDVSTKEVAQEVTLFFDAKVGSEDFECGKTYMNLGRGGASSFTPSDFRLYLHDVEFVDDQGNVTQGKFVPDEKWSQEEVALLDFENGQSACQNGTTEINNTLKVVAQGDITDATSVRFKLGVPESLNHQDQSTAKSPLNITGLYWSWMTGYKFAKIDGKSDSLDAVLFHLGSHGCTGDAPQITCTESNRPVMTVSNWSLDSRITLDLAQLFDQAHFDKDEGGAPGCMSSTKDPDCAPLFENLGLQGAATKPVFSVK